MCQQFLTYFDFDFVTVEKKQEIQGRDRGWHAGKGPGLFRFYWKQLLESSKNGNQSQNNELKEATFDPLLI